MNKLAILSLFVLALSWGNASSRIIYIPQDYQTIQAGINASFDGDTVLVNPGIYYECLNFGTHSIVLASRYLMDGDTTYIGSTIIDGLAAGSIITISNIIDSYSAIIGLTLRNGSGLSGGAFNLYYANPRILNNRILNSDADGFGGGIYCVHSSPTIIGNIISGCYSFY
jgi:hypothetical protein